MSFLRSLIARAAGLEPVVQPRLPSRYESDVTGDLAAVEKTDIAASHPREAAANIAAPLPAWEAIEPRIVESRSSETLIEHHHLERERIIEDRGVREVSLALPPAASMMTRVVERAHAPVETIRLKTPPAERVHLDTHEQAPLPEPEAPLRALLAPPHECSIAARGMARTTPAVVRDRVVAQEAPTIRVTIGRVDVRAITTPETAKPAAPRKPPFTIEDYIRLRKEGRR